MSALVRSIGAIAAILLSGASHAALIIDQNQPNFATLAATFSQSGLAQSFRQTNSNIAGAGLGMWSDPVLGTTDTVTIALWDALPNQVGANMLTSASGTATAGSFFDVFWTPVAIAPGVPYFLVFTSDSNTMGIAGDATNPYTIGDLYVNFSPNGNIDYTFRTFAEVQQNQAPEPATLALLGLGVAGVALSRRRRRSKA